MCVEYFCAHTCHPRGGAGVSVGEHSERKNDFSEKQQLECSDFSLPVEGALSESFVVRSMSCVSLNIRLKTNIRLWVLVSKPIVFRVWHSSLNTENFCKNCVNLYFRSVVLNEDSIYRIRTIYKIQGIAQTAFSFNGKLAFTLWTNPGGSIFYAKWTGHHFHIIHLNIYRRKA